MIHNNYLLDLIFKTINKRIKTLLATKLNRNFSHLDSHDDKQIKYFTIPYIPTPRNNNFNLLINKIHNTRLSFRNLNQLHKFIKTYKDPIEKHQHSNAVYHISCDATYTGQTKKQIKTRIKEHINYIKKHDSNSVLAEHFLETTFNWDSIEILDLESNYIKKLTSEMLYIKLQKHGLHKMQDTKMLEDLYILLLDKFKVLMNLL